MINDGEGGREVTRPLTRFFQLHSFVTRRVHDDNNNRRARGENRSGAAKISVNC